jgi:uncharacterized protein (DUF924 family)
MADTANTGLDSDTVLLHRNVKMQNEVLEFWFNEVGKPQWFVKDLNVDEEISQRFGRLVKQAGAGECYSWRSTAKGRLAEIIVLDQFSRNIYRDTPESFAYDPMALVLAQEAVSVGILDDLHSQVELQFLLMPFMHSESKLIHQYAEPLFTKYVDDDVNRYEVMHKTIVDRFGRYPHRNDILGRESTAEELAFLKEPNSSF